MRSPIRWFGGKGPLAKKILPYFPQHHTYVEVFGGGASLLFAKEPSKVEVYNDIDSGLVGFFRVMRDPKKFKKFYRLVKSTPYSREEYYECRDKWEKEEDEIIKTWRWFVVARMSFSGRFGKSWSYAVTRSNGGKSSTVNRWLTIIDLLPEIHTRLMAVQIDHRDFRECIKAYDTPDTLFYLDPPYVPDTRRGGGYNHEMTLQDHIDLIDMLLNIKGFAILSGYKHDIHTKLENAGWRRVDFNVACFAVGRTRYTGILGKGSATKLQPRVESIWLSPSIKETQHAQQANQ